MTRSVDLFAGAGGWDLAASELGVDPLGIELDAWACATREAAGMPTLQADLSRLDPAEFGPCDLLIASPPCTAFSMAGKGKGRDALTAYATAIQYMRAGATVDYGWIDRQCDDPTAHLVLEPLRWALALRPTMVALEQVPPVLPLWHLMADVLRGLGYSAWVGVLEAERYGVPQTRERAILMASSAGLVHPPVATHQRYVSGEPQRHDFTLEGEVLPWVSMSEALGWGMTGRPTHSVTAGGTNGGGGVEVFGGSDVRGVIQRERESDRWLDRRQGGAPPRAATEPAHTMSSCGLAKGRDVWRNGNPPNATERTASEPAPTVHAEPDRHGVQWVTERPATTVAGDPRVFPPGHKLNQDDVEAGRGGQQRSGSGWTDGRPATTVLGEGRNFGPHSGGNGESHSAAAVRVTVAEAAILQSFPPDFPFQGPRTAKFRQIGNAIPPLLARAILASLLDTVRR